jgi:hypothetical protein
MLFLSTMDLTRISLVPVPEAMHMREKACRQLFDTLTIDD